MSFFNSKSKSSYTISISLKSSSIDLQLVRVPDKGPREVLYVQRKIILLGNSQDPQLYTKQCVAELSSILKSSAKEIQALSQGRVENTTVTLYAPWFTSQITPISHKESVVISEKFLTAQLKDIKTPKQLVNLEKKVIRILTNGYSVTELSESKFSNISLDVYSSYISRQIYDTLNETIRTALPICKRVAYVTSPILVFNQIKSLLVHEDNVSFVYVGGEITEIGVIEDDSLSYYATFPIGKHDFLREVQGDIKTYDYDLLYQKEILIKDKSRKEKFEKLKKDWVDTVLSSLSSFKQDVPSKILIISDSKTQDFFATHMSATLKASPTGFLSQHRIINFDMSLLGDIITYKTPTHTNELDLQLEALI